MSAAPDKWRPSLGLVIFAVLATVAVLPLVGLFFFRLYDNQLIRQTQAELIAQSRVLATIYAQEVEARLGSGLTLGPEVPPNVLPDPGDQFTPIRPALDLTANDLLRRRPDALVAPRPAQPAYAEIGAKLTPIIRETQKVTLAGFRILDPQRSGSRWPISRRSRMRCAASTVPPCAIAFRTSRRRRSIPSVAGLACTCSRRCP
jgi:hypothetical protein